MFQETIVFRAHSFSTFPIIFHSGTQPLLSQFEVSCLNEVWSEIVLNSDERNVKTPPMATLQTQRREDCAFCISDDRSELADPLNHCVGKNALFALQ